MFLHTKGYLTFLFAPQCFVGKNLLKIRFCKFRIKEELCFYQQNGLIELNIYSLPDVTPCTIFRSVYIFIWNKLTNIYDFSYFENLTLFSALCKFYTLYSFVELFPLFIHKVLFFWNICHDPQQNRDSFFINFLSSYSIQFKTDFLE